MDSDDELLMSIDLEQCSQSSGKLSKLPLLPSKQTSWVSSAFDDFGAFDTAPKSTSSNVKKSGSSGATSSSSSGIKRGRQADDATGRSSKKVQNGANSLKQDNDELWADRYEPMCQADLAVHKKKISEVQDWLNFAFTKPKGKAGLCLLTGPAGVGKTACLKVLVKELGCDLQEWINPVVEATSTLAEERSDYGSSGWQGYRQETRYAQSQSSQFQDFLLRASKYQALQLGGECESSTKVILVEDFPNAFYRDTSRFHDILRMYQQRRHCPLVFIISDSVAGESVERKLFPNDVQEELHMANISFNPVAQTSLVKVLGRIASAEASKKSKVKVPDKETLDALAAASTGDLRGAINALQFACLKDTRDLSKAGCLTRTTSTSSSTSSSRKSKSTKPKKSQKTKKGTEAGPHERTDDLSAIGGRDTSLFIFRALGKILYCKRGNPSDFPDHPKPSSFNQDLYRDPLLLDPEDVIEKCQLNSEFFTAYLHQNYLEFYSDIDDVVSASHYLSDSDHLTINWATRSSIRQYASSVAARGLLFSNKQRAISGGGSGLGWKPLHKPQTFSVQKQSRNNAQAMKDLFKGQCWTPLELKTNLIPYTAIIKPPSIRPGQNHVLQNIGRMGKWPQKMRTERLDEKDVGEGIEEDDNIPQYREKKEGDEEMVDKIEDEEVQIDDFDD